MNYNDAERTLKDMLRQAGVNLATPEPLTTWTTFKQFAALPVEGVDPVGGDTLLFQWGNYDWHDGNGERFEIDFLRQFGIITPDGEYDHMEQLHCTFLFELTDDLRQLERGEEWIDDDLERGFAKVEAFPVFEVIRQPRATPTGARIKQDKV